MPRICTRIRSFAKRFPTGIFRQRNGCSGFAIMEVILMLVIIGIIGSSTIMLQRSSWKASGLSNRMLIAGQMIERQIEELRMHVDADPENNFPIEDGSMTENGITVSWKSTEVTRTVGSQVALDHIRKCKLVAQWGNGKNDSLSLTTYLSKNF